MAEFHGVSAIANRGAIVGVEVRSVAARAYAAIPKAIRENNYDTLRVRAATSAARKLSIARATLRELGLTTTAFDRPTSAAALIRDAAN